MQKSLRTRGIYSRDPVINPDAFRYERLSYEQALQDSEINVMDKAALALAFDKKIKVIVCSSKPKAVLATLTGDTSQGTIVA